MHSLRPRCGASCLGGRCCWLVRVQSPTSSPSSRAILTFGWTGMGANACRRGSALVSAPSRAWPSAGRHSVWRCLLALRRGGDQNTAAVSRALRIRLVAVAAADATAVVRLNRTCSASIAWEPRASTAASATAAPVSRSPSNAATSSPSVGAIPSSARTTRPARQVPEPPVRPPGTGRQDLASCPITASSRTTLPSERSSSSPTTLLQRQQVVVPHPVGIRPQIGRTLARTHYANVGSRASLRIKHIKGVRLRVNARDYLFTRP